MSAIEVYVEGTVKLTQADLDAAGGDVMQAVQNLLGQTGFVVEHVEGVGR